MSDLQRSIQEVASPIWDYTAPIVVDKSTIKYQYKAFAPNTGKVSDQHESHFTFVTPQTTAEYFFPADSYLKMDLLLQMEDEGGNWVDVTADHNIALKNNGFSLLRDARLTINAKEIENKRGNVGVGATIMKLLRETPDQILRDGPSEYFYFEEYENDEGGKLPNIDEYKKLDSPFTELKYDKADSPTEPDDGGAAHSHNITHTETDVSVSLVDRFVELIQELDFDKRYGSYRKRREHSTGKFSIKLPLSKLFGYLHDNPIAYTGMQMGLDLELYRDDDDKIFQLIRTDGEDYRQTKFRFYLQKFEWWIPFCKPSLTVSADLQEYFLQPNSHINLHWTEWIMHRPRLFHYNEGGGSFDIPHFPEVPTYLFVVPQLESRVSGRTDTNKYSGKFFSDKIFDHIRLKAIHCELNGHMIPERRYECNFVRDTNKHIDYHRLYKAFIDASFDQKGSEENIVSYELFRKHYPIITFDFTKLDNKFFENQSSNRITITFETDGASVYENEEDPLSENEKAEARYSFYCVLLRDRYARLGVSDSSMNVTF